MPDGTLSGPWPQPAHLPPIVPLVTRGLALNIGGHTVLEKVDLSLGASGITMVMGPNGAGKSMLLKLLHGLIFPTSGEILFGGALLSAAIRRRQAMAFQKPVLLRRSVAANIDFVLRSRGRADTAHRDALLARVGLDGRQAHPARLLSGGEQQRLALARALAIDPDILFLDEPTASLDPASVLKIEEIVVGAGAAGTRIVFVSHDVGQARRLADDVLFLSAGRVVEHSTADRFFDHPQSRAARGYLAGRLVV